MLTPLRDTLPQGPLIPVTQTFSSNRDKRTCRGIRWLCGSLKWEHWFQQACFDHEGFWVIRGFTFWPWLFVVSCVIKHLGSVRWWVSLSLVVSVTLLKVRIWGWNRLCVEPCRWRSDLLLILQCVLHKTFQRTGQTPVLEMEKVPFPYAWDEPLLF